MSSRTCYTTCTTCRGDGCTSCADGRAFAHVAVVLARKAWCDAAPGVFGYLEAAKLLRQRTGWDIVSCCELVRHVARGERAVGAGGRRAA